MLYVRTTGQAQVLAALGRSRISSGRKPHVTDVSGDAFPGHIALGLAGDWTVVWDGALEVATDTAVHGRLAALGPVLALVLSSVSDTYGFWWYEHGGCRRHFVSQGGRAVATEGTPLAAEPATIARDGSLDEDGAFELSTRMTGVTWTQLESLGWELAK